MKVGGVVEALRDADVRDGRDFGRQVHGNLLLHDDAAEIRIHLGFLGADGQVGALDDLERRGGAVFGDGEVEDARDVVDDLLRHEQLRIGHAARDELAGTGQRGRVERLRTMVVRRHRELHLHGQHRQRGGLRHQNREGALRLGNGDDLAERFQHFGSGTHGEPLPGNGVVPAIDVSPHRLGNVVHILQFLFPRLFVVEDQVVGLVPEEVGDLLLAGSVEPELAPSGQLRGQDLDAAAIYLGRLVGEAEVHDEAREDAGVLDGHAGRKLGEKRRGLGALRLVERHARHLRGGGDEASGVLRLEEGFRKLLELRLGLRGALLGVLRLAERLRGVAEDGLRGGAGVVAVVERDGERLEAGELRRVEPFAEALDESGHVLQGGFGDGLLHGRRLRQADGVGELRREPFVLESDREAGQQTLAEGDVGGALVGGKGLGLVLLDLLALGIVAGGVGHVFVVVAAAGGVAGLVYRVEPTARSEARGGVEQRLAAVVGEGEDEERADDGVVVVVHLGALRLGQLRLDRGVEVLADRLEDEEEVLVGDLRDLLRHKGVLRVVEGGADLGALQDAACGGGEIGVLVGRIGERLVEERAAGGLGNRHLGHLGDEGDLLGDEGFDARLGRVLDALGVPRGDVRRGLRELVADVAEQEVEGAAAEHKAAGVQLPADELHREIGTRGDLADGRVDRRGVHRLDRVERTDRRHGDVGMDRENHFHRRPGILPHRRGAGDCRLELGSEVRGALGDDAHRLGCRGGRDLATRGLRELHEDGFGVRQGRGPGERHAHKRAELRGRDGVRRGADLPQERVAGVAGKELRLLVRREVAEAEVVESKV